MTSFLENILFMSWQPYMPRMRCMHCFSARSIASELTIIPRVGNSDVAGGQERSRQLCLQRYERAMLTDAAVLRRLERSESCVTPQQRAVFEGAFPPAQPHTTCNLHTCRILRPCRVLSSMWHHAQHVVLLIHPIAGLCGVSKGVADSLNICAYIFIPEDPSWECSLEWRLPHSGCWQELLSLSHLISKSTPGSDRNQPHIFNMASKC